VADTITYVGHSTVLLDLEGVRILTDPILRRRVFHLRRTAPVARDALPALDAVLVSHAHWDHLDLPSLERLGRGLPVVVPRGIGSRLRRRRFTRVLELDVGEHVEVGGLEVRATRAEHDGSRGRFGITAPAVGFAVTGSRRVYFAGDTDLFPEMAELAPLDVALLPVAGWGKGLGPGHLDPGRAAEALSLLRPRVAVPIHWGTFSPFHHPRPTSRPAEEFAHEAARLAPEVAVRLLAPGQTLTLD
jgi:L-ascorbate metabolism protein UlaG (beta-lactamase superfamily)